MQFTQDQNLTGFSTLGLPSTAEFFTKARSHQDVRAAVQWCLDQDQEVRVLGGGSNLLLPRQVPGLVLSNQIFGVHVEQENADHVWVTIGAGENWHEFTQHAISQGWYGLENLSLIPGTVGAAPVQNIGAYGVELEQVFESLTAVELATGVLFEFGKEDCQFSYRDSLFKQQEHRFCITEVQLKLSKHFQPVLTYGPLKDFAGQTAQALAEEVCAIRRSKLPDPAEIPNAGSFFKNPIVTKAQAETLHNDFPELVMFPATDGQVKLAAGWLLEKAGFKGYQDEATGLGMYKHQALVLINPNYASLNQLLTFVGKIQQKVWDMFGVLLEVEPRQF